MKKTLTSAHLKELIALRSRCLMIVDFAHEHSGLGEFAVEMRKVIENAYAKQDYWAVDVLRSPVVEFQRGYHDDRSLRPGKVYYTDGFFDLDGTWFEKPAAFRSWAASVLRLSRRATTKRGSVYIAPIARDWSERTGGRLLGS